MPTRLGSIACLIVTFFIQSPTIPPFINNFKGFEYVLVPPVEEGLDTTISFEFAYNGIQQYDRFTVVGYIINDRFPIKGYAFDSLVFHTNHAISSFDLEYQYFDNSNDRIILDLYVGTNTSNQPIDRCDLSLFKKKKNTYQLEDDKKEITPPIAFSYYQRGKQGTIQELFTFESYDSYYENDYYSRIDLDIFKFKYTNLARGSELMYKSALLTFENVAFPRIRYLKFERKGFELNIVKEGDYYTFKLASQHYVDKITRDMTRTATSGCVPTNYIYLPRNYQARDISFCLEIEGIGYQETSILFASNYKPLKEAIGNCAISEYCIGTNSSTPEFSIGTTITR